MLYSTAKRREKGGEAQAILVLGLVGGPAVRFVGRVRTVTWCGAGRGTLRIGKLVEMDNPPPPPAPPPAAASLAASNATSSANLI